MRAFNDPLPVSILCNLQTRTIPGILIASISVIIGMWLERLIIVVPSLANPRLPYPTGIYIPSHTEWMLFIGGISVFILGYMIFARFFPVISIWEIEEGRQESAKIVTERINSYMPDPEPSAAGE
jgi:Ni/Fe-hydrogenase subunit HybB-like protein